MSITNLIFIIPPMNNNSDSSHRSDTLSISNLHCNSPSNMSNVTCETLDEEKDVSHTSNDTSNKKDTIISKKQHHQHRAVRLFPLQIHSLIL